MKISGIAIQAISLRNTSDMIYLPYLTAKGVQSRPGKSIWVEVFE